MKFLKHAGGGGSPAGIRGIAVCGFALLRQTGKILLTSRLHNNKLSIPQGHAQFICGDDVRKFEPIKRLNIRNLDLIIRGLRLIYKENPEYFDVPNFANKVY
ncbi:MAG: hypothetical protein COU10_03680 [Candidatus Harrisonbacteria bacterium CG10_big_fil_rev_8_21_14_0_10_45_28]|uniref:Uncharacterized protein n=1 Tax=Candidatus Harrisonbacteria bacterium CG10_big_fil_rev_8_21_14_0_10_45_28 TaxID=1974586 RepID=A0A2H0UMG9_9BACT|nr:MAG: hypothetical protein COU10_03680 [Candidatus Harrisonbacteria bacterium CG10_big_fil_rev_8_21_14_0_10_45_28]